MKREVSKNERLDRVASLILRSGSLRRDEIEEIASGETLFADVRRKIAAGAPERHFGHQSVASVLRPRRLVFAGFAAVAVITAVFAVSSIMRRSGTVAVTRPDPAKSAPENPVQPVERPRFQPEPEKIIAVDRTPRDKPAAARTAPARYVKRTGQEEQPVELYAFADMNSTEPVAGSRVVRVELPRASLVSLGVNIPLDGDKQLIKTDLLIGPDGVPRAIRLVDKFENF